MKTVTAAARRWSAIIDEYEASGMSQRAFAKEKGIKASTLATWRRKLGRTGGGAASEISFTEVELAKSDEEEEVEEKARRVVVRLSGGKVELVVDELTDLSFLKEVVEALC